MSCYEWERGTIKIPTKEWAAFRKRINTAANEQAQERYAVALRVWTALKDRALVARAREAVKAWNQTQKAAERIKLRDVTTEALFDAANDMGGRIDVALCGWDERRVPAWLSGAQVNQPRRDRWGYDAGSDDDCNQVDVVKRMVFVYAKDERGWVDRSKKPKLVKPKKPKAIPLKETRYGNVSLDLKAREATWDVGENNHACESARNTAMGRAFFDALSRVTWTRGSGGKIVGNDEYNREGCDEGGGNYVKDEYGPKARARAGRRGW